MVICYSSLTVFSPEVQSHHEASLLRRLLNVPLLSAYFVLVILLGTRKANFNM